MGGTGRIPRPVGDGESPGGRILGQEKNSEEVRAPRFPSFGE